MSQSPFIQFVHGVREHGNCGSWERINGAYYQAVRIAILIEMPCEDGDVHKLRKDYKWGHWAGVSGNAMHMGESLYGLACQHHQPFAIVYENDLGRVPFILSGKRLSCGDRFIGLDKSGKARKWRVTGWSEDNQSINVVGYETSDFREEGRRKLMRFDRANWLEYRKGVQPC